MRALIVYESMYGNTHRVAEAIGEGLRRVAEVSVVAVSAATDAAVDAADLVVVGGPTHAHGMTRQSTRSSAIDVAHKTGSELLVDPDAEGPGLREWFAALEGRGTWAAAFDTRMAGPPAFTGRASKGISRQFEHHGLVEVLPPESFLVSRHNRLQDGEIEHARRWGDRLAEAMVGRRVTAA